MESTAQLFNSYEVGALQDALMAHAAVLPKDRWQSAYRAAAIAALIATPTAREGVWGDQRWVNKYNAARQAIVDAHPAGEDKTVAEAARAITTLLERVERLEAAF
jgi:hypothetical protein